jgi:transcriptional regulator with XRE-family HTH domain
MGKDENIQVGANITFLRKQLNETLATFGARFGMSYAGLARIERGDVNISIDYLKILSELSGYSIDDIIKVDLSKLNTKSE